MKERTLLHVIIDKETKKELRKLIDLGFFSTEAEIAREAIRNLLINMKDKGDD